MKDLMKIIIKNKKGVLGLEPWMLIALTLIIAGFFLWMVINTMRNSVSGVT
jgi:hypothetical protein